MSFTEILLPDKLRNEKLLKRDPLYKKLNERQRQEAISKAVCTGKKYAGWLDRNYGDIKIEDIFESLDVQVNYSSDSAGQLSPYSVYRPKNSTITMNVNTINSLVIYLKNYSCIESQDQLYKRVSNVIYYHELFHHLETKFGKASNLYKMKVLDFKIFSLSSGIRTLSEIGAHTFTREKIKDVGNYIGITKMEDVQYGF